MYTALFADGKSLETSVEEAEEALNTFDELGVGYEVKAVSDVEWYEIPGAIIVFDSEEDARLAAANTDYIIVDQSKEGGEEGRYLGASA